jgi:hypothetical protein
MQERRARRSLAGRRLDLVLSEPMANAGQDARISVRSDSPDGIDISLSGVVVGAAHLGGTRDFTSGSSETILIIGVEEARSSAPATAPPAWNVVR